MMRGIIIATVATTAVVVAVELERWSEPEEGGELVGGRMLVAE
jgi:hypothetical protein